MNTAQQTVSQAVSDKQGLYSFPNLPVGHYDLTIIAVEFTAQKKTGISVDTDAAMLAFRFEAFNVFNHAQFYGPASEMVRLRIPLLGKSKTLRRRDLSSLRRSFRFEVD